MQEVHKDLWKGSNRKFSKIPWHKIEVQRHNAERTPEQQVWLTSPSVSYTMMHGQYPERATLALALYTAVLVLTCSLEVLKTEPARVRQMCSQATAVPSAFAMHPVKSLRSAMRHAATTLGESTEEGQAAPEKDPGRWHRV